jgi:hypothetical protein
MAPKEMTLREYFIGQALAGLASIPSPETPSAIAEKAFNRVDAVFVELNAERDERQKGNPGDKW